jgi:hypothetical protein
MLRLEWIFWRWLYGLLLHAPSREKSFQGWSGAFCKLKIEKEHIGERETDKQIYKIFYQRNYKIQSFQGMNLAWTTSVLES